MAGARGAAPPRRSCPGGLGLRTGEPRQLRHLWLRPRRYVFRHFTEQYNALLAEQEAGACIFPVLVGEDGTVLGRFNLYRLEDCTAELGYRVAQHVAGRGVATAAVQELCRLAAGQYGLCMLKAATTHDNVASQKVLTKAGFVPAGPAEPGGRPGIWYQRDLATD